MNKTSIQLQHSATRRPCPRRGTWSRPSHTFSVVCPLSSIPCRVSPARVWSRRNHLFEMTNASPRQCHWSLCPCCMLRAFETMSPLVSVDSLHYASSDGRRQQVYTRMVNCVACNNAPPSVICLVWSVSHRRSGHYYAELTVSLARSWAWGCTRLVWGLFTGRWMLSTGELFLKSDILRP